MGMADLGRIAVIRKQRGQSVDQVKAFVGTGQKKHSAIGTDRDAVERGGDSLLADVWQKERKQGNVLGGAHGRFCPGLESGIDN
jgi:hypothetical protein